MEKKDYWLTFAIVFLSFSILVGSYWVASSLRAGIPIYSSGVEDAIRQSVENAVNTNYQLNQDVLNLSQAATYLQISEQELQELATLGAIPHVKIKQEFRFSKEELNEWVGKSNYSAEH